MLLDDLNCTWKLDMKVPFPLTLYLLVFFLLIYKYIQNDFIFNNCLSKIYKFLITSKRKTQNLLSFSVWYNVVNNNRFSQFSYEQEYWFHSRSFKIKKNSPFSCCFHFFYKIMSYNFPISTSNFLHIINNIIIL